MQLLPIIPQSVDGYLATAPADTPVHFFAPAILADRLARFRAGFPGLVTYAVKANPAEQVIAQLWAGGLHGFDVASPAEIAMITTLCPGAPLHYNNPVRSGAEIAAGIAAGVVSWSVDEIGELDKLSGIAPGSEVAVRFKLPVAGAAYNFGAKFGAEPDDAVALLQAVAARGLSPALTFHVGTQCCDPAAWTTYIHAAAGIAARAGVTIARLNVGGGFPSGRDGQGVDLQPYFDAISAAVAVFPTRPVLICEPGRGLVGDAFAYAVQVKSSRGERVYLSDGIYGGLSEFPSMGVPAFRVVGRANAATTPRIVYGPTCDSLDVLPGRVDLPTDLGLGDWIVFSATGAYLNGVTTMFNGYGGRTTVPVTQL